MERIKLKRSHRQLSCSCFICLEPVKLGGFNGEHLTSLNFLFNYLKIGNKVGPVVCEKCGENLVKFMKLGKTLEKVRLEMDYLLGVIQLAISKSNGGTKRAPVVLISVRECVLKKCGEKAWNSRPEIILERCDVPSILKTGSQSPIPDCSDDWSPNEVVAEASSTPERDVFQQATFSIGLRLNVTSANEERRYPCQVSGCHRNYCHRSRLLIHYRKDHPDFLTAQDRECLIKKCKEKTAKIVLQRCDHSRAIKTEDVTAISYSSDDWVPNNVDEDSNELDLLPSDSDMLQRSEFEINQDKLEQNKLEEKLEDDKLENKLDDAAINKMETGRAKCPKLSKLVMKQHLNAVQLHHIKPFKCSMCDKSFTKISALKLHKATSHKTKPQIPNSKLYSCEICNKFFDEREFRLHLRDAHTESSIPCDICKKMFKTQMLLKSHVFSVHEKREDRHQCKAPNCDKKYSDRLSLLTHYKVDHHYRFQHPEMQDSTQKTPTNLDLGYSEKSEDGESVFECNLCGKKLKTVTTARHHVMTVHPKNAHRCPQCDFTTKSKRSLSKHIKRYHSTTQHSQRMDSGYSEKSENGESVFECDHCGKKFKRGSTVRYHIKAIHGPQTFRCPSCDFATGCRRILVKHIEYTHKETTRRQLPSSTKVKCDKCSKTFCNKRYLILHNAAIHIRQRLHQCHKCDKSFTHRVNLWSHNNHVHLNPKRNRPMVSCTKCSETFVSKNQLRIHMNTVHLDPRPFKCSECQKSFTKEANLRTHIRVIHLGVKPHMCECCGKAFSSSTSLRSHKITHENPKPQNANSKRFPCPKCERTFGSSKGLSAHKRYFHLLNGFQCELCEKKFFMPTDFKRHVQSIHEKIKHPCQVPGCDKVYSRGKALRSHHRLEHPDIPVPGPPEPARRFLKKFVDGAYVYECKLCDKHYKTADSCNGHVKAVHEPKTTLVCDICGYTTASNQTFRNHVKSQHRNNAPDPSPVVCAICSEKFTSDQYLNQHIRHKHGPKEFKCHVCYKIFKKREHLTRHVSGVHEKERQSCQVEGCNSSYSQQSDLLKHYKSQHPDFTIVPKKTGAISKYADMFTIEIVNGEKVMNCKLCPNQYRTSISVRQHIKNVHGPIKFKCRYCDYETISKLNFEGHVYQRHNDQNGLGVDEEGVIKQNI